MRVRLEYVVQDPLAELAEGFFYERRGENYLDGPVCRRVAVLDFDERTGALLPGVRFEPPGGGRRLGRYGVARPAAGAAPDRAFQQVSVFATVLKTLEMFEEPDALGREVSWAFGHPQLLVVPRAGEWANAFYERASGSLQFFFFPSRLHEGKTVHTSLSHDIVAHEATHAILDGIAPDLYNALTPQSLALHEAVADLAAAVMAFRCRTLVPKVLEHTGGSIDDAAEFSGVAEEFGRERTGGRAGALRNLANDKTFDPADRSRDAAGEPNFVSGPEPHVLSEVLTGALYRVMLDLHRRAVDERVPDGGDERFSVSGKALFVARERFKRMVFRALDYLPPGEVSFADYGRAILAADQTSHPGPDPGRELLVAEFVRRRIVPAADALAVATDFAADEVAGLDLDVLVESDWAAYDFANRRRAFLGIPEGVHFRVRPRLKVTKDYYLAGGRTSVTECLFKVSWDREEPNPPGRRLPRRRQITVGTTLAIDWATRRVRALLKSHAAAAREESDEQRAARDAMLGRLLDTGVLQVARRGEAAALDTGVHAEVSGELMRVRGAARLLHAVGEREEG